MTTSIHKSMRKYADLIVSVGLNVRAGQKLIVRAPIEAAPLVRLVVARAYDAGARLVEVEYQDEQVTLARFQHAPRDSFEEYPAHRPKAMEEHLLAGGAYLSFAAEDPDLLKDQDPKLVGLAERTAARHMMRALELITRTVSNWCVISLPIPSWAKAVFPELPEDEAMERLWQAIFDTCRLNVEDPVSAWRAHVAQLQARSAYMNAKRYSALRFIGPGTDLTVGLPDNHIWLGGQITSLNGIECIPNLPTEEIFTLPHRMRVDGTVRATRPLSQSGALIEDFDLTFKAGRVVDFHAGRGEEVLRHVLETDDGASRLGEVALVPHSSPVSQSGLLFLNTLFDENAASHLALGHAYEPCLEGGDHLDTEAFEAAGGNHSLVHTDFMIGSDRTDVDGLRADGSTEPVMRAGEWAFEVA